MPAAGLREMEASLDQVMLRSAGRRFRYVTRLRARMHRARLDRALAESADPNSSDELAFRAGQLVSDRNRAALAAALARLRGEAQRPAAPRLSAAVPVSRSEVAAAEPQLALIETILQLDRPVHCGGVARLERLLTDGAGPLYVTHVAGALRDELERVIAALEGEDAS